MQLTGFLLRRLLISGSIVLVASLLWLNLSVHRNASEALDASMHTMTRILQLQGTGLGQGISTGARFPDWLPITQVARPPGACVRLLNVDGDILRSACRGLSEQKRRSPAWFEKLYAALFSPGESRSVTVSANEITVIVQLEPDPQAEIAAAWLRTTELAVPAALTIGALCLTVFYSIRRALQPIDVIRTGLMAVRGGALETRIPLFPWMEFNQIGDACNALTASLAQAQEARTTLTRRLLEVQETERHTLAGELHDEFGQHLSAIGASAAALRTADSSIQADAARIENSASHLLGIVRNRLQTLNPWSTENADLEQGLRAMLRDRQTDDPQSPRLGMQIQANLDVLSTLHAGTIYRITQEGITNAMRHARASRVEVALAQTEDILRLTITDDGVGVSKTGFQEGFGIAGMRERAAACGGSLTIDSDSGAGFKLIVELPLTKQQDETA